MPGTQRQLQKWLTMPLIEIAGIAASGD